MTCRIHGSISIGQLVQLGFKAKEWSMASFYLEKYMQPCFFFFFLKVLHICYLPLSRNTATNLTFLLILHRRDNVRYRCQPDNLTVLKKDITNSGKIFTQRLCVSIVTDRHIKNSTIRSLAILLLHFIYHTSSET